MLSHKKKIFIVAYAFSKMENGKVATGFGNIEIEADIYPNHKFIEENYKGVFDSITIINVIKVTRDEVDAFYKAS